eukprot:CAMPEP_0198318504 /NCGR_PEP_ID=MMETSP1450-20131203/7820_1 /TAXON_ID=753684 ORGANISM="Madagascaria erythrocladiodes, Strain CCMP3234" /NCGR_SAMPLE_ID=MMETSP1450 /ASSEMBLY_ACC=CAM_ASM_001115 /LENGTH=161 /DNA_ID=CAMNT_0044021805 /DNA_START=76 /DNA_END=561 /DNA_ORIENTATION=-
MWAAFVPGAALPGPSCASAAVSRRRAVVVAQAGEPASRRAFIGFAAGALVAGVGAANAYDAIPKVKSSKEATEPVKKVKEPITVESAADLKDDVEAISYEKELFLKPDAAQQQLREKKPKEIPEYEKDLDRLKEKEKKKLQAELLEEEKESEELKAKFSKK